MADKALPPKDLTSTLNLRQLRAIPSDGKSKYLREQLSPHDLAVVKSLPKESAILIVLKGAGAGSRFLLNSSNIKIGRELNNDISLDDITVSRSHAIITKCNKWVIRDLGSLNGTYINAVAVREQVLSDGDEIQIGKFHLTLFIGDE
ncbi:MAG: FHA domain-containing protein [Actinobacteria bacterium]|nr:FHA domain-containing protein [Actinomycetota bacterium]